ncbi:hypothetical protein ACEPAF_8685 [Sanghuangporus sanghuang]
MKERSLNFFQWKELNSVREDRGRYREIFPPSKRTDRKGGPERIFKVFSVELRFATTIHRTDVPDPVTEHSNWRLFSARDEYNQRQSFEVTLD